MMDFEHFQRAVAIAPRFLFLQEYLAEQAMFTAQLSTMDDPNNNNKLQTGTGKVSSSGAPSHSGIDANVVNVGSASGFELRAAQLALPGGVRVSLDDDLVRRDAQRRRDGGQSTRSGAVSTQSSVVYFPELHHSSGVMSDGSMDHSGSLDVEESVISSSMMLAGQTPTNGAIVPVPPFTGPVGGNQSFGTPLSRTHRNSIVDRLHVDELEWSANVPSSGAASAAASLSGVSVNFASDMSMGVGSYSDVITRVDGEITAFGSSSKPFATPSKNGVQRTGIDGSAVTVPFGVSNSPSAMASNMNNHSPAPIMYTLARPSNDVQALPAASTPKAGSSSSFSPGIPHLQIHPASSLQLQPSSLIPHQGPNTTMLDGGLDFVKAVSNSYSYSDFGLGATELVEVASLLERSGATRDDASPAPVPPMAASTRVPQPPATGKSGSPRLNGGASLATSVNAPNATVTPPSSVPSNDGGVGPLSATPLPATTTLLRYSISHIMSRPGAVVGVSALDVPYRVAVCSSMDTTVRIVALQPARVADAQLRDSFAQPKRLAPHAALNDVVGILQADAQARHCCAPASGKLLCVCTTSGSCLVYDLTSGKAPLLLNHSAGSALASFSPSGRCVAVGTDDGWITVWQLRGTAAATVVASLTSLQGSRAVTCLTWQPGGDFLIGAGSTEQCAAVVWHANTTASLANVRHPQSVHSVSFDSSGRFFASCCLVSIIVSSAETGATMLSIPSNAPTWSRHRVPMSFVACTFLTSALPQHLLIGCSDKTLRMVRLLHVGSVLPLGHSAELLCERTAEVPNVLSPSQTKDMDDAVASQGTNVGPSAWSGAYIGDTKGDVSMLTLQPASAAFLSTPSLEPGHGSSRSLKRRTETTSLATKGTPRI